MERFFKNILMQFFVFFKRFFMRANYDIRRVTLEYTTKDDTCNFDSIFWHNESQLWDTEHEVHTTDVTWLYRNKMIDPPPPSVSECVYRISYVYGPRLYKYVTRDHNHQWPPVKVPGFNPPIREAWDGDGTNITERVKKFAGPNSDFHGETLVTSDIGKGPLRLVNLIGRETVVDGPFSRKNLWVS
jgi:hypothetical protein